MVIYEGKRRIGSGGRKRQMELGVGVVRAYAGDGSCQKGVIASRQGRDGRMRRTVVCERNEVGR